jgi:hypothetical protein
VQISALRSAILSQVLRDFPQFLHTRPQQISPVAIPFID